MPATGKITYWENLSSAANADLVRQKQQAIQGSVGGMLSGEVITRVTEAEPHGFVLTFSLGRIAHMTVSDPQGKPSITVQFLRSNGAYSGGLLGGLKNVFSTSGWKRDIAAVRAGDSWQRGQRYVIVATTKGVFQVWDLTWNGTQSLTLEVDAKGDLLKSITEGGDVFLDRDEHLFEALDFTLLPRDGSGKELARAGDKLGCKILVMTCLSGSGSSKYALVGLTIFSDSIIIDVVHPISCYTTPRSKDSNFKPRVLVPEPAQTAFVVFEKSIVLVSLVEVEASPSSQLQMEARTLPDPFQDTIDFRKDKGYRVVGCGTEIQDRDYKHSSCVLMVHGYGVVRVASLPMKEGQSNLNRATVTAKTKIEQAVFFGNMQQNLLDFSGRPEINFALEEVEAAAMEVNDSIMKSTSEYIPAITASMDHQLQLRSTALADLMKHLKRHYQPLSRLTRWNLLWSAEKMAAAKAVWRSYNTALGNKRPDEMSLLTEIVDMLHENFKNENQPNRGETDAVRHWFVHDIWRLERIIPWAEHAIEELYSEGVQDAPRQARLISEANDLQLSALETAFRFRESNAALYGVDNERLIDGVLHDGYEDFPETPWTSTIEIVTKVKLLVDLSREMAINHMNSANEGAKVDMDLVLKLARDNPRQIQICCQTYIERFRWLKSRSDPQMQASGEALKHAHFQVRKVLFVKLIDLCLSDQGIKLAEKYHDMGALVDLVAQENADLGERLESPGLSESEGEELRIREISYQERIKTYFTNYGTNWATAFFDKHVNRGKLVELLDNGIRFRRHLTSFLRGSPVLAKVSWINEVIFERNYLGAAVNLKEAQKQETSLWSKKIELSMSKLSLLAAKAEGQVDDNDSKSAIRNVDSKMAILSTQEKLYAYIRPTLRGAIDETAETDLAMEQFCKRFVKGKPAFHNDLKRYLTKLVARQVLDPEALVDILTLMDVDHSHADDEGFADRRFFLALMLLRKVGFDKTDPGRMNLHEDTIWRRCMIQDDWEAINRTELKDDTQVEVETGATALFKTLREGYKTGKPPTPQSKILFRDQQFINPLPLQKGFWDKFPPTPPTALLSAGTSIPSLRTSSRYINTPDSVLTPLARDYETEDALLEQCIEKGRLEMWWKGVVEAARMSVRNEADREGEERRRRRSLGRKGKKVKGPGERVDGEGDVVMA